MSGVRIGPERGIVIIFGMSAEAGSSRLRRRRVQPSRRARISVISSAGGGCGLGSSRVAERRPGGGFVRGASESAISSFCLEVVFRKEIVKSRDQFEAAPDQRAAAKGEEGAVCAA